MVGNKLKIGLLILFFSWGFFPTWASPPQAKIQVLSGEISGIIPQKIKFSADSSFDPEGEKLIYEWDFGNGISSNKSNPPAISYQKAGSYFVQLQIQDEEGFIRTDSLDIQLSDPILTPLKNKPKQNPSAKPSSPLKSFTKKTEVLPFSPAKIEPSRIKLKNTSTPKIFLPQTNHQKEILPLWFILVFSGIASIIIFIYHHSIPPEPRSDDVKSDLEH